MDQEGDGLGLKIKRSDDEQPTCRLKVLIFFRTTRLVEATVEKLRNKGFNAFGSYSKSDDRAQTFEDFRSGEIRILLATDLFQRGIHIDGLTHVVNFDVPSPEREDAKAAYIHRVGRTGRLCEGKRTIGKALTFLDKRDKDFCSTLKSVFDEMDQFSGKELGTWQKDPKKKPVIDLLNGNHNPRDHIQRKEWTGANATPLGHDAWTGNGWGRGEDARSRYSGQNDNYGWRDNKSNEHGRDDSSWSGKDHWSNDWNQNQRSERKEWGSNSQDAGNATGNEEGNRYGNGYSKGYGNSYGNGNGYSGDRNDHLRDKGEKSEAPRGQGPAAAWGDRWPERNQKEREARATQGHEQQNAPERNRSGYDDHSRNGHLRDDAGGGETHQGEEAPRHLHRR